MHRSKRKAPGRDDLLDHLVGEREQIVGDIDAERFGGLEVDYKFEFGRLQNGQLAGLGTLENSRGVNTILPVGVRDAYAVAEQTACHGIFAKLIDGGQPVLLGEGDDPLSPRVE